MTGQYCDECGYSRIDGDCTCNGVTMWHRGANAIARTNRLLADARVAEYTEACPECTQENTCRFLAMPLRQSRLSECTKCGAIMRFTQTS